MAQKTVVVLGGGVGGMSAAHMLASRGFKVTVYDRNKLYVGGKARSVDVPGTNTTDVNKYLPGEHGFRFFPGFYKHVIETMKEIPFGDGKTAYDNFVSTDTIQMRQIGLPAITVPLHIPRSLQDVREIFAAIEQESSELSKNETHYFADRVWQLMTSCNGRFLGEYETIGWWDFTNADNFSNAYQRLLVDGLTRSLVASKARLASTRTVGTMFLQLLYTMIDATQDNTDRVLKLPTNEAWLTKWLEYLVSIGVDYHKGHELTKINMTSSANGAPVESVQIMDLNTQTELPPVIADYYVLAVPVEVAAKLIQDSPEMLGADPSLQNVIDLSPNVEWMNGIQFYLSEQFDMHRGHTIYSGSNYALTSISQKQFWPTYDLTSRFDGKVRGILSVDISDWTTPGNHNGKPAKDCTRAQVIMEVFKQLQDEINIGGQELLKDEMLVFVHLDEDIYLPFDNPNAAAATAGLNLVPDDGIAIAQLENKEPLLVNLINTWKLRPEASTNIPNLTLASDYVKTYSDLACMEGANEAARRATNSILVKSGNSSSPLNLWPFRSPFLLSIFQFVDWIRWKLGRPWSPWPLWPF
jgi:uncharacterized protein with NAD-binding domain and iron-sulfur cluster